jgi:uncharacterized membrane protein YhaH (DUF805 family)
MFKNPFSFDGRIRRSEFGISFILFVVVRVIIMMVAAAGVSSQAEAGGAMFISLLFSIPLLWFLWAQGAKRCHDIGNSGWFQLIPFYALWMLFQDGEPGINQYGENPKNVQNNFNSHNNYQKSNINTQNNNQSNNSVNRPMYNGGHNSINNNNNNNTSGQENNNSNNDGSYKKGSLYN